MKSVEQKQQPLNLSENRNQKILSQNEIKNLFENNELKQQQTCLINKYR